MNFWKTKSATLSIVCVLCMSFFVHDALAKVGVGMGAGEIRVTQPIKPGGMYTLPSLRIFNTGDEVTVYGMNIAYHQDHPELRPQKDWFSYNPTTFTINPGESQEVEITMMVPVKTEPGDYFAFVESGPVATGEPGTSVGVAVATKLYFNVVPANIFEAISYRVSTLFAAYAPWSWIGLGVSIMLLLGYFFRKFFSFNISLRKQKTED